MQTITIKELVVYRRKPTDNSMKRFPYNLKNTKAKEKRG